MWAARSPTVIRVKIYILVHPVKKDTQLGKDYVARQTKLSKCMGA